MPVDHHELAGWGEAPDLSLVIPLYRSSGSIEALIQRLEGLSLTCAWELVMVDDGSPDDTVERARRRLRSSPLRVLLIRHARNYGEHQAVLTGYRNSRGHWVINLDDDLQNPPEEALRLWRMAEGQELDVVYGNHRDKRHAPWRNLGSRFANRTANWLLDLPERLYLSSFRCVAGPIARQVAQYSAPYPYIDGLLSQYTQRIGTLTVHHDPRLDGESSYNMKRLVRLWLTIFTSFSIMPLRLVSLLGLALARHRSADDRDPVGAGPPAGRGGGGLALDHLGHPDLRRPPVPADRRARRVSRPHLPHGQRQAPVVRPQHRGRGHLAG